MFTLPCIGNFLRHGKAVIDIPSVGFGMTLPDSLMKQGDFTSEQLDTLLNTCAVPKEHINVLSNNRRYGHLTGMTSWEVL